MRTSAVPHPEQAETPPGLSPTESTHSAVAHALRKPTPLSLLVLSLAILFGGALYVRLALLPAETQSLPQFLAASPDVLHVSPLGSDRNPGTSAAPLKSLERAAELIEAGDTVLVAPGTYEERGQFVATGTAEEPIEIRAQDGGKVVVTEGLYVKGSYITLDGFEVTGARNLGDGKRNADGSYADAAVQATGEHITLRHLRVHDTNSGPWAIMANGNRNVVRDSRTSDVFRGHISVSGDRVVVRNNRATVSPDFFEGKHADYKSTLLLIGGTSKMLVEDNYLRGPSDGNLIHIPVPVANLTFRDNTILLPGVREDSTTHTQTFGFYGSAHNVTFDGNVIGSAQRYPDGFVPGFTHFFFGTTDATGEFTELTFKNNVLLGQNDGAYYLQFKAWDRLRGLRFENNLVDIQSGWRLPDDSADVVARRNVILKGAVGGARDHNLYAGPLPAGEGASSMSARPIFVRPDVSEKSDYGATADWRLKGDAAVANIGVLQ